MRGLKMPNTRQYRYLHKGDNEWLSEPLNQPSEEDQEAWDDMWKEINADNTPDIKVEFTEDMFINSEYGETPEWVNVTIKDSGVLPFKMARGILSALDGARGVMFHEHFSIDISQEWGGWGYVRLEVGIGGAFLTITAKHSPEELELNITEQFNQAIGETA
jgi:hypothetical protein